MFPPNRHVGAKSVRDMADEWGCTHLDASARMTREGWVAAGVDDYGEQVYLPPEQEGENNDR